MSQIEQIPCHGYLLPSTHTGPAKTFHCPVEARPGYTSMLAHHYQDTPETLAIKVDLLAQMILASTNFMVYTGAGISTSSGIGDYASKNDEGERPKSGKFGFGGVVSPIFSQPSVAHRGMKVLADHGHLKQWIQQVRRLEMKNEALPK